MLDNGGVTFMIDCLRSEGGREGDVRFHRCQEEVEDARAQPMTLWSGYRRRPYIQHQLQYRMPLGSYMREGRIGHGVCRRPHLVIHACGAAKATGQPAGPRGLRGGACAPATHSTHSPSHALTRSRLHVGSMGCMMRTVPCRQQWAKRTPSLWE